MANTPGVLPQALWAFRAPSNTAWKPIYQVIEKYDIKNILIVVVRYFGGVELGTWWLIQAYRHTADELIQTNHIVNKPINTKIEFSYDYKHISTVQYMIDKYDLKVLNQTYKDEIHWIFEVNKWFVGQLKSELVEKSAWDIEV